MIKLALLVLTFSTLTAAAMTWISPKLLEWYASPPVPIGVTCDPAVSWALSKLVMFQSIGWGVGAALGVAFFLWIRASKDKSPSPSPSQS